MPISFYLQVKTSLENPTKYKLFMHAYIFLSAGENQSGKPDQVLPDAETENADPDVLEPVAH